MNIPDPGVRDFAEQAWEALKKKDRAAYNKYWPEKENYHWHHVADGSLELIDKNLHTAYQHTGLNSVLRKLDAAALMLIPGLAYAREGRWNDAGRDVFIEVTPLWISRLGADLLGAFFEECQRELGQLPDEDP